MTTHACATTRAVCVLRRDTQPWRLLMTILDIGGPGVACLDLDPLMHASTC